MSTELTLQRSISEIIEEYDHKAASLDGAIKAFEQAGDDLKTASCVAGTWGNSQIDTGSVYKRNLEDSLLKSAWRHIYEGLQLERIMSARDKKLFEQAMVDPAPFTLENIRATFGDYIANPRDNILRGLAEVFSDLDPAFKSHDKVKIGVKGLPKRIIVKNVTSYWSSYGSDQLRNVISALAQYRGEALPDYNEMKEIVKGGKSTRGISLKTYKNNNGHLYFEPDVLRDINMALAEYYGEVLPDCSDDGEPKTKTPGTAVAKDLQYYPTPKAVVERIVENMYRLDGAKVLEPSCGCGRFLDALKKAGAKCYGVEVDADRAQICADKGHKVLVRNFLETIPEEEFDFVVMNPPFYGTHYAKHVEHALKFLKPGGTLTAILPVTARYDHGLLDGQWQDLPFGSFRESGTNINTTVLTIRKPLT